MAISANKTAEHVSATDVGFSDNILHIQLSDGRSISIPLDQIEWLDWLAHASPEQRANWSLEPGSYAVYWEDLDDGIEITHLLSMQPL